MRQRIRNILFEATAFKDRPNINDAFWKWFGDSKVVDEKKYPLVVYHGSNVDKGDEMKTWSNVAFFARSVNIANDYAITNNFSISPLINNSNVSPCYLKIERPVPISLYHEMMSSIENDDDLDYEGEGGAYEAVYRAFAKRALNEGYDGVIGTFDHAQGFIRGKSIFMVFDSRNIKSIYNQGTWNINDPDITK